MLTNPNYVVNQDYIDYVNNPPTDNAALTKLLAQAEHYIDLVGAARPIVIPATDTLHLLTVTGAPTGGSLVLTIQIAGNNYVTAAIPFNATAQQILAAIAAIPSFPGTPVVLGGPLPYEPVWVGYRGSLAGQVVPAGSVAPALTGGSSPNATFVMSAQGGGVGKRFNLASMRPGDIMAVKNATCAQAAYMTLMGDKLFDEAQYQQVRGPSFTTTGRLPVVAPKARRELALAGIRYATARSRP